MKDDHMYEPPLVSDVTVSDRWGEISGVLTNDGQLFSLTFRGHRFEGSSPDALELVTAPEDAPQPPRLDGSDLSDFTLRWPTPVTVRIGSQLTQAVLTSHLVVPDRDAPDPSRHTYGVSLSLALPDGEVATRHAGDMEQALSELQRDVPDGVVLQTCTTCALSDYHPGGNGFMGSLACFRNTKEEFEAVRTKDDLFALWDSRAGYVQETYRCPDFT
ncbi:DUF6304 family protein [Streptomyces sp. MBT53]|uniref:DUF6304 family protein n=1 Tax=Streptomyces sp. MBT53 TaxID=1488384 RepID=UPI0019128DFB|nr:DUF6304 family protein [Streptomyces sp. MBT53]MBK6014477.1 hypothetical protein [Streptomyces sp. MBT53]